MRVAIIVLAVLGIAFVAFMLIGSNRQQAAEDEEPPAGLAFFNTGGGAPRLVEEEIRFPRDGGDTMGLAVPQACGTPARLATVVLTEGTSVRVAYQCETAGTPADCRGPSTLCEQVLCLVPSEGARGTSGCSRSREFIGEANLSIGPERGRLTIIPPFLGGAVAVTLR